MKAWRGWTSSGARSVGTLVVILTLLAASTLWAKPPRREQPQRVESQTASLQEPEAKMPNTLYWNSVTKQWNAASYGGTLPATGDSVYVDGRSQSPMMLSLDRTGDAAGVGFFPKLFDVSEDYTGDIGEMGNPLKITAEDFVWRGRGRLYFQPADGSGARAVNRLTIDTPNIAHEIQIGPTFVLSNVTEFHILRGRLRFSSLLVHQRAYIGSRTNRWADAYVKVDDAVPIRQIYQVGGNHIYKGVQPGDVGDEFVMSGGYCQFDGTAKRYIQTGGHVDFGIEALSGTAPLLTEAWLLGGSMDATKRTLAQSITTLYIDEDNFDLTEDSKLTVGTRIKLGGP